MALPDPIPDNPSRWPDWKNYNSPDLYARLCLDSSSNATAEIIEDHCRRILVWWQKKLPLKNQPSNPLAQMLRGGLDEAPHFLAEARTLRQFAHPVGVYRLCWCGYYCCVCCCRVLLL